MAELGMVNLDGASAEHQPTPIPVPR